VVYEISVEYPWITEVLQNVRTYLLLGTTAGRSSEQPDIGCKFKDAEG
jgi:hypothetical protein